ncbi:MAG: hypothetical protein ACLS29_02695, partial [Prevotellamassilia sp.]
KAFLTMRRNPFRKLKAFLTKRRNPFGRLKAFLTMRRNPFGKLKALLTMRRNPFGAKSTLPTVCAKESSDEVRLNPKIVFLLPLTGTRQDETGKQFANKQRLELL